MAYARVNWNSTTTYVSAENLNVMDKGIKDLDTNIGEVTNLATTAKTVVPAINELKDGLNTVNNNLTYSMNYITNETCSIGGRHVYQKGVAPDGSSWGSAPIAISAPYSADNTLRAGMSFENQGLNAGYLYLDLDNKLKLIDNTGTTHIITMT